jgi:hypothetical protein
MTDFVSQPNYNNDVPLERANVQKHSTGITHLKEVISGTNIVKIVTAALADLCVTTAKIAALAVTTAKIADDAITTIKILNGAVTTAKLDSSTASVGDLIQMTAEGWAIGPLNAALDDLSDVVTLLPTAGEALVYSHGTQIGPPATAPSVADGGAGGLTGTFTYKVTFYDEFGETSGGPASASTGALASKQVNLTSIPTQVGAVGRKVYRSAGAAYQLVATINDNTTTTLTDNNVSPSATLPTANTTGELLWRNEAPVALAAGQPGQQITTTTGGVIQWSNQDETWNAQFPSVQVGDSFDFKYDDNYSIQQWSAKAGDGESGSIEFDILKSLHGPPDEDPAWYKTFSSIVASAPPAISGGDYAEDANLTGWTIALEAGRWMRFSVTSVTGIQNCTLGLKVRRTD